ncbi:Histone acetyltransferase [Aphelenchoides bicaudatus]|nr:Histone acetyltransferase [Aphelenchoides bicaudatus]
MVCVFDEVQLQNWGVSNPKSFVCQECIRCSRCLEPIFDPGNVQCITCGHAYHEVCKPETQITHDFPSISRIWYCHVCEENLLRVLDFKHRHEIAAIGNSPPSTSKAAQQSSPKRPSKRKLKQVTESPKSKKAPRPSTDLNKSIKSPATKKAKVGSDTSPSRALRRLTSRSNPETSSPSKPSPKASKVSPTKTESPNRVNRNKELTDGEHEKKRLSTLERLKESIKYEGEYQCIAAQESIFSRLNEEYLDEEEELNEPKLEHYVPFASVGNSKRTDSTDLTFFYGNTAYRPRFSKFLRTVYAEYDRLSFCQKCLMAFTSPTDYLEHNSACAVKHPPGSLIYQEKNVSVWEVFGKKENTYCRRLAIFAKTFIGSKSVFFEVEQFNFYVLTENDSDGVSVMAGYFSKEIKPTANNNLSCLLILPWLQRKGYGVFLIDLSYHLSLKERKIGSPEHPLSDAGLKTYRQYWYSAIMSFLREKIYNKEKIDLIELKEQKGIDLRDILETMIVADMTFILDNQLQINVETPMYTMLSLLRRRYVKPKLLQVKARAGPFTTYN